MPPGRAEANQAPSVRLGWPLGMHIASVALAYLVAAELGLAFRTEPEKFAIFWPPNGLLLGLLLISTRRDLLVVGPATIASLVANLWAGDSLAVCLGFAVVNLAEPWGAAWLWRRWGGGPLRLATTREVFLFYLGVLAVCSVTAVPGAAVVVFGLGAPDYPSVWLAFWLADAMGILLVTPLLVTWADVTWDSWKNTTLPRLCEVVGLVVIVLGVAFLIFAMPSTSEHSLRSFAFPLFPVLLWAALRFGSRGSATAVLVVSLFAIWNTGHGRGPFGDPHISVTQRLLLVQLFLSVLSLSTLALAAALAERQRAQDALRDSEERYRQLTETIEEVFWVMTPDLRRVLYVSPAYESIWGQSCVNLYDNPSSFRDAIHPDDRERIRPVDHRPIQGKVEEEYRIVRPDGAVRWIRSRIFPLFHPKGEVWRIVGISQDVTERKEAERRFERIVEFVPDGVVIVNQHGRIVLVNAQAEKLFGYPRCELLGQVVEVLVPERWRGKHPDYRNTYLANPSVRAMGIGLSLHGQRKDGSEFPVEISLSPLEGEEGVLVASTIRDLTDRQRAEAELRASNDRLELVIRGSAAGIWDWDIVTNQCVFSPQWYRLLGHDTEDANQTFARWTAVLHPEEQVWVLECLQRHLQERAPYDIECRLRTRSGAYRWYRSSGQAIWDATGRPRRMAGSIIDITDRKNAEEQVRASLGEKEMLLKEIHHRVKNNLAIIGSLLYLQSTYTQDEPTLRVLQDCQDRVRSMALVHEWLYRSADLARINFAQYTEELANQLYRNYSLKPDLVRLRLEVEPIHLDIDRAISCGLIVNELFANALKHAFPHGQSGEIRVSLHQHGKGLVLSIADTGVGLPDETTLQRQQSLGMRLVRSLARQLDARIDFIRLEPGTEVRLTLEDAGVLDS